MLLADTVTAHLAERFSANAKLMKDAGDQVRRIGEHFGEMKMEDKKRETYALFFRNYPTHHAAGQLVMTFGEREFQAKNYAGAMTYYKQIEEIYTNSTYYFDALNRMAQIYKEEGDNTNEIRCSNPMSRGWRSETRATRLWSANSGWPMRRANMATNFRKRPPPARTAKLCLKRR